MPSLTVASLQARVETICQDNFNTLVQAFKQRGAYGASQPQDLDQLLARLADAWAWLEARVLVGPSAQNPSGDWRRVTTMGQEVVEDPNAVAKVWAAERPAGDLHPALSSARSNFALGDYETASFAARTRTPHAIARSSSTTRRRRPRSSSWRTFSSGWDPKPSTTLWLASFLVGL